MMSFWFIGRSICRGNSSSLFYTFERTMAFNCSKTNRLGQEKSPYLLQHASNPVEWYPWGEEAFSAAKAQNKLIFLSVGYSTCHWCHVMERESFENHEIAKLMNEHFINIKVDREERPDVDKVYMTFVTASSGRGGWPMSVFLTPDLVPVAGGTYFPPTDTFGRPGFPNLLKTLSKKWVCDREKFLDSGKKIMEVLKRNAQLGQNSSSASDVPSDEVFARAFTQLGRMYEPEYGGFGDAPKFPQPSNFNFLFAYKAMYPTLDDAQKGVDMCVFSLKMMERGGIHDHVAQGFARYSTDRKWHVPHFEKMLYDQAQLVMSYLDAFLCTKQDQFARVVHDIITYVFRDLSHPLGGFYSAEDADSSSAESGKEKKEGAFCVWSYEEICELLSAPVSETNDNKLHQVFCFHYSVAQEGNVDPFQDPHDELKNKNVLMAHGTVAETASEFEMETADCERCLKECCQILYEARLKRPRPHLDDKMITAWNGMMLGSAAKAGAVLKTPAFIDRAVKNAEFIRKHLYKNGLLLRAAYREENDQISLGSEISGFSDDYAWMIRGLFHLYEATLDDGWLAWAEQLQDQQNKLFWDREAGGYFLANENDNSILLRIKDDHDGAEPSVNSVSSGNLVRLSRLLNRPDYEEKATTIFKVFADRLTKVPVSLPEMVTSLLLHTHPAEQIILAGKKDSSSLKEMLETVHTSGPNPNRVILIADTDHESSLLYSRHKSLWKYIPRQSSEETTTAYICKNFECSLPIKCNSKLIERMTTT